MNKFIFPILALTIISTFFGFDFAYAGGLTVNFEKQPLFSEASFYPGQSVTRYIEVTNATGSSQRIAIEAINQTDPSNFGAQLNLQIKQGSQVLFNNSLANFFTHGEQFLSIIENNQTGHYDLTITFNPNGGNEFQNVNLGFDLLVGLQGQEGEDVVVTTYGSLGGGGGGLPPGLQIRADEASCLCENGQNSIEVVWQTNYFSTSSVIYDIVPNKFDFSKGEPSFGYAYYQNGDASGMEKVTSHRVVINNLIPGQTYYYRVVSHASPATIGLEKSIKIICQNKIQPPVKPQTQTGAGAGNEAGSGGESIAYGNSSEGANIGSEFNTGGSSEGGGINPTGGTSGGGAESNGQTENLPGTATAVNGFNFNNAAASVASFLSDFLKRFNLSICDFSYLLLILSIACLVLGGIYWKRSRDTEYETLKDYQHSAIIYFIIGGLLLAIFSLLFFTQNCFINF